MSKSIFRTQTYRIYGALAALALIIAGVAASHWMFKPSETQIEIVFSSNPFPLAVGQTTFFISVSDADGKPISNAEVTVLGEHGMGSALPINLSASQVGDGEYQATVTIAMMGHWTFEVIAELPTGESVYDEYSLMVYPVPEYDFEGNLTYVSNRTVEVLVSANPEKEYWVVIPQGTNQMNLLGRGDDLIPVETRLQVNGRNTLVIRNDDITSHFVGPFFVHAGETIRQEFTQPAVFVGACSIRHDDAQVTIIIE